MTEPFAYADDLGPEKIVHLSDPKSGLRAILVVDNTACGPAIGGCRMAPDVTLEECFRLARAMTLKNAAAGLPHGGGKSVIAADPHMPAAEKDRLIRAFARAIGEISSYIVGPDMGTNEAAMAIVRDEIGRSVGLPWEVGGIPLDEIGATGLGLAAAADAAHAAAGIDLAGARVAVQGFGAVGRHAARFLAERHAVLVAASDSRGAALDPNGLDLTALAAAKHAGGSVTDVPGVTAAPADAIVDVDCDIWIPAARPDVVTMANVDRLKAKLVLQGANIPMSVEAEESLHARGVIVVPDFIANAGGVICAAVEYRGGGESQALQAIVDKVGANTRDVLERAARDSATPRAAALAMARERVLHAMAWRR